ncbi:MAG: peptidylprolyl isomerase, partial [Siphonobacter aquaeclarae]|nr:peptidylprolyl isomerase [Siphonobacter aquaeclarae]
MLMTIGPKKVTAGEFLYHFRKNPVGADSLNESAGVRDYLPLFINYKLKVLAGESQGIDTTAAFREELAGYRKVSAQSFMTDKQVTEALVKEAYDRLKEEINASHILLEVA